MFKNLVAGIADRKKAWDAEKEAIPSETSTFSAEAINKIILIRKDIPKITKGLDADTALSALTGYLDSHTWLHRFTTGEPGATDPSQDSQYWVTPEGASLRLKMSEARLGVAKVIQPFCEKIYFLDHNNEICLEPNVGRIAQEYLSREFLRLQGLDAAPGSFESQIRTYAQHGKIVAIENTPDGFAHTSTAINSVRY